MPVQRTRTLRLAPWGLLEGQGLLRGSAVLFWARLGSLGFAGLSGGCAKENVGRHALRVGVTVPVIPENAVPST